MKKSNFSIRAIENMARIAAKEAEVRKTLQQLPEQSKADKKQPHKFYKTQFETQVKAFKKALASSLSAEEYRIIFDDYRRNVGKAIIKVYKVVDLERQQNELIEYRSQLKLRRDKSELSKPFQAQFTTMYVLYQSSIGQDRLESIAVYGAGATQRCATIAKSGVIFGFPVRSATVEIGRRPFIDVYLKQNRA